ncbi:MAG: DNA polymerase III subunit beta [Thermodesulfobacteriota bacterium]|jgi:DNA polymerase-3 subunit beta
MECVIEKEDLLRCLYLVQGVVEKRSSLPILAHVLIECGKETLSLGATDLEIGIRQQCKAAVKKPGSVTSDARKLYEIIRELPPERIAIRSTGNGWVEVSSGRSRFRMASLDPKEFPAIVQPAAPSAGQEGKKAAATVSFRGETLREMIEKTLFAASPDETRLNLSGVYVEAQPKGKLRMVASDGHRLSLIEREAAIPDPSAWPKAILPRKGLVEARKILERTEGEIELSIQGSVASLRRDDTELAMRLVEGEFPDYHQVIPREKAHTVTFSREDLFGALRRLLVLTTERSRGVKLQIENERMEVSVNTPDLGEGVEEIAVTHDADPITIGFNGRYLTEVLSVIDEGQKITLFLKDEVSPGLLQAEEDPDFSYVIMPMRIF